MPHLGANIEPAFSMVTRLFDEAADHTWIMHIDIEHELLWGVQGMMTVATPTQLIVVPPGTALWITAGVPHEVQVAAGTRFKCSWVAPERLSPNWQPLQPIAMHSAAAELLLLLRAEEFTPEKRRRIEAVVIDLLDRGKTFDLALPMPRDPRLRRVADAFLADPSDGRSLEAWSDLAALGSRSFMRHFARETGMSFGNWRQLARVRFATVLLGAGRPVADVAARVGYANASAFTYAFRRVTGRTPASYSLTLA